MPNKRSSSTSAAVAQNSRIAPAHKPRLWINLWFLISSILVAWDCTYLFLRPHSMAGGKYHEPWFVPYAIYQNIDYVYGIKAFASKDGFPLAQGSLNVIENILNMVYLYLATVKNDPAAVVFGFMTVVITTSKTLLYFLKEYFCGFANVKHNSLQDLILYYIIPDGAWVVVPGIIMFIFGRDIARSLRFAAKQKVL